MLLVGVRTILHEVDKRADPGHGKGNKDNEPESIRFSIEEIIVLNCFSYIEKIIVDGHDNGHHGQGFHDIELCLR